VLNTFDLPSYVRAACAGLRTTALRMPFMNEMSGWWWLYWRFYDTRIPWKHLDETLGVDASKARRLLRTIQGVGLAFQNGEQLELTEAGAFWLHLVQNYFALNYVNTLWTQSRREPWPQKVVI
jgi:oxygen-independent coproporphyrinogen III oxidase